jgi:hypothetical protein
MRVLFLAAALLIVALPTAGSAAGPVGATRLSITVWPEGRGVGTPVRTRSLRCRPARGSHPAPARACRRLFANLNALRPVPADRFCDRRFGGPQQARVTGRVNGRRVHALFNRRNGCEIERWNRLAPVFRSQTVTTSLRITVWPNGRGGRSFQTTLTCEPTGGTHPSPARACARILGLDDPFGPSPTDMPCVLVPSGPQVAAVEGSFRERGVDARFDRSDSCETRRWDRVGILFAEP